jgi:polyhydroxybutyrate depolymerase
MTANPYGIDADSLIEYWVNFNGCVTTPVITAFPDLVNDSITVEYYHYADSASTAEMDFIKATGAIHEWLMTPYNDVNYTEEIWNFFKKHSLNTSNPPIHYNIYEPYIYPNPATDNIQIMNLKSEAEYFSVFDSEGRQIIEKQKMKNNNKIGISSLPGGLYFVTIFYKDLSKGSVTIKMEKNRQ